MEIKTFKCEGEMNDHMLHYEQVFGNVFKRRKSKCCGVLMKRSRKVKGDDHSPNGAATKNQKILTFVLEQLFLCQCKPKFLLETYSLY